MEKGEAVVTISFGDSGDIKDHEDMEDGRVIINRFSSFCLLKPEKYQTAMALLRLGYTQTKALRKIFRSTTRPTA